MSRKRRSFTTEYKVEAARRVIDSGRTIAEVARDLGLSENLLRRWVADQRRRIDATATSGNQPLTVAERTELARLRKQVSEQEKEIAFLKKASAYFVIHFDGATPQCLDLRLLQTPRAQCPNMIG